MNLAELIAGGESLTVELKKDVSDHDLVETVVCLANAQGGVLIVGVDDDGKVVGARPRHGTTTDPRRIEAMVSSSTRPSIGVRAELQTVGGKTVLVLHVPTATIPTATSTGRYLRRALGGDGKPACVPLFVFETAGSGLAQDPSAAVVGGVQGLEPRRAARGGAARQPPHHHAAPEESFARRCVQASRHRRAHGARYRLHLLRSGALRASVAALRRHAHFGLGLLARSCSCCAPAPRRAACLPRRRLGSFNRTSIAPAPFFLGSWRPAFSMPGASGAVDSTTCPRPCTACWGTHNSAPSLPDIRKPPK
jgi:hypothetical protein